jgi:membrane associated rhomboid family serine protease
MLVKPLKFSFSFFMPLGLVAIIYFLYNMAAIYFEIQSNVSFISHVIGFIVGIPFGISWSKDWVRHLLITICLLILYYGLHILLVQVFS